MEVTIESLGIEFTFDCKEVGTRKVNFYRELYGCKKRSHGGKYLYIKDGVLSNLKYLKPTRSTIILSRENAKIVKDFFKGWDVIFDERLVILNTTDATDLNLNVESNWNRVYENLKKDSDLNVSVSV